MRVGLLVLIGILLVAPALAYTASIDYIPALFVQDMGTAHEVNNITIACDQNVVSGSWVLMGTNDQVLFYLLDSRKFIDFTAGVQQQFNISNTVAYRWHYFYATEGFPVGSTLTIHLNYSTPVQTPKEQFNTPFNWTVKRSPKQVEVFDFSKNPLPGPVNYSITVDQNLAASQSWSLFGSDSLVIGDVAATPVLLDSQSAEPFTANVIKWYDITSLPVYKYYILYVDGGFDAPGLKTEVSFYTSAGVAIPVVYYAYAVGQSQPVEVWHVVLAVWAFIAVAGRRRMFIRHEKREEDKV